MKRETHVNQDDGRCLPFEEILYLRKEERTIEEENQLAKHIAGCNRCASLHKEVQKFHKLSNFDSDQISYENLSKKILKNIGQITPRQKSLNKKIHYIIQIKRSLAAACILLFIIFSIEQYNTVSKITKLENQLKQNSDNNSNSIRGDLLVVNHFISWDELRSIAVKNPPSESFSKSYFNLSYQKGSYYWNRKLTALDKYELGIEIIGKTGFRLPLIHNKALTLPK